MAGLGLPADVLDLARRTGGVLTTAAARAAGINGARLRRLVVSGALTNVARGCFVVTALMAEALPWQRHRLRARAVAVGAGSRTFLSGWSAVVTWDLPTVGAPPAEVELVRSRQAFSRGSLGAFVRTRATQLPTGHAHRLDGVGVMSRAWTTVDLARRVPLPHGLLVADAAARAGADLAAVVSTFARWRGAHRAAWVVQHADPLSESPIETLGRFTCIEFDLPLPVSNAWIGRDGPEFRVDGLWPWHWAADEGDGATKYDDRPDASAIVRRQTEREWQIRRLGVDVLRYGWDLAYRDRPELAGRIRELLAANPPRDQPMRWWKHVPGVGPVDPTASDWPSPRPGSIVLPAGWSQPQ